MWPPGTGSELSLSRAKKLPVLASKRPTMSGQDLVLESSSRQSSSWEGHGASYGLGQESKWRYTGIEEEYSRAGLLVLASPTPLSILNHHCPGFPSSRVSSLLS